MKKKKGISSLIVSVLILGFTIVLVIVSMTWAQRVTTGIQEQTDEQINPQMICITEVEFKIKDFCMIPGGGYQISVENNGKRDIDKMIVRFYQSMDNVQVSTNTFPSGIQSYSLKTGTFYPEPGLTSVKFVEAIPEIRAGEKSFTCPGSRQDYGSLYEGSIIKTCTAPGGIPP